MKAKLIKLLNYLIDNNIPVVASKKGTGMNCYQLEQIESHSKAIETLALACDWQLRYWNGLNEDRERKSAPLYYIGPSVSNQMSNEDILGFAKESK